jgi:hypothetical protein
MCARGSTSPRPQPCPYGFACGGSGSEPVLCDKQLYCPSGTSTPVGAKLCVDDDGLRVAYALLDADASGIDALTATPRGVKLALRSSRDDALGACNVLAPPLAALSSPRVVLTADMNGDGVHDAVVVDGDGDLRVVLQPGAAAAAVSAVHVWPSTMGPANITAAAVVDADADGSVDVVVTRGARVACVALLRNVGVGGFVVSWHVNCSDADARVVADGDIAVADVNGDGGADVVVAGAGWLFLARSLVDGGGFLNASALLATQPRMPRVVVAHLDGDGGPDLVFFGPSTNSSGAIGSGINATSTMSLLSVAGSGAGGPLFAAPVVNRVASVAGAVAASLATSPLGVVVGDVDASGYSKVLVVNSTSSRVTTLVDFDLGTSVCRCANVVCQCTCCRCWCSRRVRAYFYVCTDGDLDAPGLWTNRAVGAGVIRHFVLLSRHGVANQVRCDALLSGRHALCCLHCA